MTAYYNEIDPYAAQWLRNLIEAGHIAPGDVDERSIVDVRASDLCGYTQCHFFAGIGGWSVALRLAGWPDDRSVWTGSCPCQPFSAAGAGKAGDDERHLWPAWFPLIAQRGPPIVFGEQVEAAIGWGWIDSVFADLEGEGYACGTTVLPACGVGAPHIRQRLWFVADASSAGSGRNAGAISSAQGKSSGERQRVRNIADELLADGTTRRLADGASKRRDGGKLSGEARAETARSAEEIGRRPAGFCEPTRCGAIDGVADTTIEGRSAWPQRAAREDGWQETQSGRLRDTCELGDAARGGQREFGNASQPGRGRYVDGAGVLNGFWQNAEWIACTDGKARPVGPGSFPLGHGIHRRPSKLRAYGNAIVPQVAAEFIKAANATK